MMLKSYVQRMEASGIGDRIILLAHDELIKFYENSGFRDQGQSEVKFGGGGWNDMVSNFHWHKIKVLDCSDRSISSHTNSHSSNHPFGAQLPLFGRQNFWVGLTD